MNSQAQPFKRLITALTAFLYFCCLNSGLGASSLSESVKLLDVEQITSFDELKAAVELLGRSTAEAVKESKPSFGPRP